MQKISSIYARASAWALPVLAVVFLFSLKECSSRGEEIADLTINLDSTARRATFFENENGQQVAQNTQLTTVSKTQLKALTDSIFKLRQKDAARVKEVQQYARIIQEGHFGDKFAEFVKDSAQEDLPGAVVGDMPKSVTPCNTDTNYVKVPQAFTYLDSSVNVAGRVTRRGVWLDKIDIQNTLDFRTVTLKKGFLNLGREYVVQVVNSNPGIKTVGVTSITVAKKVSAWNRWIKPLIFAGLAAAATERITR